MCLRPDCRLCSIAMHGFKMEDNVGCSPVSHARLRYGRGIYFTSVSGKANDFSKLTARVRRVAPPFLIEDIFVAPLSAE